MSNAIHWCFVYVKRCVRWPCVYNGRADKNLRYIGCKLVVHCTTDVLVVNW